MECKRTGLILRAAPVSEGDLLLHVLSAEQGLMLLSAKGARSRRSKLFPYAHILLYGEFTLSARSRDGYGGIAGWLREISPIEDFYNVSLGIERLALVTYLFELLCTVCTEGQSDPALLRLTLNTLWVLTRTDRPLNAVKGIFELRCACELGFAPDLTGCLRCGAQDRLLLVPDEGGLLCADCLENEVAPYERPALPVSPDVLRAMRHIVGCEQARLFAFRLPEEEMHALCTLAQTYLLSQIDGKFPTLDYFRSVYPEQNP